jgi:glycosyltransferase involved in cell wall biosynthesis
MRVLLISNVFPPGFIGGYELGALDVARGLVAHGHQVQVLTSDYFMADEEESFPSLPVQRTLLWGSVSHDGERVDRFAQVYYNFHNVRTLGHAIRRFRPDVAMSFNLHGLGVFSILRYLQSLRIPTIVYLMDNIWSGLDPSIHAKYERIFGALEFGPGTRVVAMSRNLVREAFGALGVEPPDVTYIPGWSSFDERSRPDLSRRPGSNVRFVFSSQVAPHKGTELILEAAERLVRLGLCRFTIDLYGAGQVGPLLQKVAALGLGGHVAYRGQVPKERMLALFQNYDAMLLPTWEREPFGFVTSEAAVAGCLPIMTSSIGAAEWFLDGYDCIKISRDGCSLSRAMQDVMLWSDVERVRRRTVARESARKSFSFSRWFAVIARLCHEGHELGRPRDLVRATRGVESGLLFLNTLFRETISTRRAAEPAAPAADLSGSAAAPSSYLELK